MNDLNEGTEILFNKIKGLGITLSNLAGIVQNPLVKDSVSVDNLKEWIYMMDTIQNEIKICKEEVIKIIVESQQ